MDHNDAADIDGVAQCRTLQALEISRLYWYQDFVFTHNRKFGDRVSNALTPLLNAPEVRVKNPTSDEWRRFLDPHFHPALSDVSLLRRTTRLSHMSLTHLLATSEGLYVVVCGHKGDFDCQKSDSDCPRSEIRRSGRLGRDVVKCTWGTAKLPKGWSMRGGLRFFEVCSVTLASST